MNFSKLSYHSDEMKQQTQLNELLTRLYNVAKAKSLPFQRRPDDIVRDGFYPYFSHQNCKILFIARESLGLSGENYIDLFHNIFVNGQKIGKQTIRQSRFHSLLLSIAYGLNNKMCNWEDIPDPMEIARTIGTNKGVSFAFMNLSKFSNDGGDWPVDWDLVDAYIQTFHDQEDNLFSQQIDIIEPDVIITGNLENRLNVLGEIIRLNTIDSAAYCKLRTTKKEYLLIDTYHFMATRSKEECFYKPILKGLDTYQF